MQPKPSTCCSFSAGTGGEKSAVAQTVGVVNGGVTLIIENTLALGADQARKIQSATPTGGPVGSFQLDTIKSKAEKEKLR